MQALCRISMPGIHRGGGIHPAKDPVQLLFIRALIRFNEITPR